ncbi:uncharacterized protein C17orf80 homolog isoform X2 [Alligator mississippiensis]|nr:uncharacterized protein C17orf80 homolog isoform X2 [Alligator mississippiensis]XP_059587989.1 uncharacterized protein C17orf80 homolog isoform X2 [Alligator mississippiensis]XP_059587990.1 uncharacterized protein C17orf80 homolog isoform X2 [Alligator mississippiensis]XP_059587991.1 uncharacterized protein C17orf80 homolog isoform X2 [Alligator mississippiensis]
MAKVSTGMELCPFCRKPFKRLKMHLPHCKMAGDERAPLDSRKALPADLEKGHPEPAQLVSTKKKKGQSKGQVTTAESDSKPESQKQQLGAAKNKAHDTQKPKSTAEGRKTSDLHTEKPDNNTEQPIKRTSKKTQKEKGKEILQNEDKAHMKAAGKVPAQAAQELLPPQKSRSKKASGRPSSAPGKGLELAPGSQDAKSASGFPNEPVETLAPRRRAKAEPAASDEDVGELNVVTEKPQVKVCKDRKKSKPRDIKATSVPGEQHEMQSWYVDLLDPDCLASHGEVVLETTDAETLIPEAAESNELGKKSRKGDGFTALETPVLDAPVASARQGCLGELAQQSGDEHPTRVRWVDLLGDVDPKVHTRKLHPSVAGTLPSHRRETPDNRLSCIAQLVEDEQQPSRVSDSPPNTPKYTKLALKQCLVSSSQHQPLHLSQVSGNSRLEGARGLEWFPELYPSYRRLNAFRGKPLQWDVGIVRRETVPSFSKGQQGPLLEKCLPDVTLGELPVWLVTRDFSPKGLLNTTQTAWNSYYSKYIDMKKGGAVGISMLLAGYCVLSYCWQYEHMKASRWRKYH